MGLVGGYGKGGNGRSVVEHVGDAQTVLEHMADVIGSIDMAAQGSVGNTVGHGLHLAQWVVNFDYLGLRVSLLQNGLLR
ncbi:hypothetical protein D3C75_899890 [compost metagenome]